MAISESVQCKHQVTLSTLEIGQSKLELQPILNPQSNRDQFDIVHRENIRPRHEPLSI